MSVDLSDVDDLVLAQRFLDGDETAFRVLYRRHTPRLRMLLRRLLGPGPHDADDVLQDVWIAACHALPRFRGDSQFATWLTAIGIRTAHRRIGSAARLLQLDDATDNPVTSRRPVEALDLDRALMRLGDAHRIVVILHDVEGYTHEEIAAELGIPSGTSRSLLTRARRALKRLLNPETTHAG